LPKLVTSNVPNT